MVSESVMDGDYPIIAIETTAKITERMINESYTAAALSVGNPDVITHLSDQQVQVFMRSLAGSLADAERKAAIDAEDRREIDAAGGYHEYMERFADGEPDAD